MLPPLQNCGGWGEASTYRIFRSIFCIYFSRIFNNLRTFLTKKCLFLKLFTVRFQQIPQNFMASAGLSGNTPPSSHDVNLKISDQFLEKKLLLSLQSSEELKNLIRLLGARFCKETISNIARPKLSWPLRALLRICKYI